MCVLARVLNELLIGIAIAASSPMLCSRGISTRGAFILHVSVNRVKRKWCSPCSYQMAAAIPR